MTKLITQSGRTKELPPEFLRTAAEYPGQLTRAMVAGLDEDGRIVIDRFEARTHAQSPSGGRAYVFGLTLCCNASDKGTEDGVVCRGCYSDADTGNYLYRADDGSFPGLDQTDHIED